MVFAELFPAPDEVTKPNPDTSLFYLNGFASCDIRMEKALL